MFVIRNRNVDYAVMNMMTSHILKFVDFTKIQKSRYLENETLFFLKLKKFVNYTSTATLWQKYCGSGGNP